MQGYACYASRFLRSIINVVYNTVMEIANQFLVRQAGPGDARDITRLLQKARFSHVHADWHPPVDWLGQPGFVVAEEGPAGFLPPYLAACLAITADPLPAAWVRVAAVHNNPGGDELLLSMLAPIIRHLQQQAVQEIGWLLPAGWPESWLVAMQFSRQNSIETYFKSDLSLPRGGLNPAVQVRPVQPADFPALVAIEAAAFAPLWRHSHSGLELGWRQSLCFHVAELAGRLVGFEYSVHSQAERAAHLVRISVDPAVQGLGVGSALLTAALEAYRRQGLRHVSLNTQVDNLSSQQLYAKFGFHPAGYRVPVWVRALQTADLA